MIPHLTFVIFWGRLYKASGDYPHSHGPKSLLVMITDDGVISHFLFFPGFILFFTSSSKTYWSHPHKTWTIVAKWSNVVTNLLNILHCRYPVVEKPLKVSSDCPECRQTLCPKGRVKFADCWCKWLTCSHPVRFHCVDAKLKKGMV